jgi:probable F420-dependent oxidoreductase
MHYGATLFSTDKSIHPVQLALALEERGFDSLWVPEHTHIPTSRITPAPTGDPVLPEEYLRSLDPFVSLTAAAAVTARLRIGTGIALVAQRDPIVTAKAVASLDWVSGGRFTLGVGYGWNIEEMADHGVDPRTRRARTREHVLAMRRLWEDDAASYSGQHFHMSESWSWPKPVQRPLPVLIGGDAGPTLFAQVAEFAEGWIPIGGHGLTDAIPRLKEAVEATGRDPSKIEVVPFGSIPDQAKLEHFQEIGVTQCILRLPSAPESVVMPILDRYAGLISEMRTPL